MALEIGSRLGHYDVTALIGAGGMGQVYQATDTTLNRQVALKILPEAFAGDPDRLARFQREAQVLASLNHPNIAQIHGLEESDDTRALVLELVEGPTLADRIAHGPIPVDEALPIAKQIAEALEAAHEQGIIHRDLKPANVKVKDDGTVKVLDFGLAKAFQPDASDASQSMSPTISLTAAATQMGMVIGTAAYMAPEQAKGKVVDKRADVWAFGAVLYEMLTGRRAFGGGDVSDTLAMVLMKEVDWSLLPADTPASVRRLLERCLARDPKQRIRDIGDAQLAMDGAFESTVTSPEGGSRGEVARARRTISAAVAAAVVALVVGVLIGRTWFGASSPLPSQGLIRFALDVSPGQHLSGGVAMEEASAYALQRPSRPSFALSPDGRLLVYVGSDGDTTQLYRHALDQPQATPIPDTEGASRPFFAPDGRTVVFSVGDARDNLEVKRVPTDGGGVRTIAASGAEIGAAYHWTEEDTIPVAGPGGVYELPANGGSLVQLTRVESGERGHTYPLMLPERRGLLFNVQTSFVPSEWPIVVQPLDGGERRVVVDGGSDPRYLPSGHIVFARRGTLMAVSFDVNRLEATGDPVVVLEDVMHGEGGGNSRLNAGAAQFRVSNTGSLAYVPGGIYPESTVSSLVWVDQRGEAEPLPLPPASYLAPRFSPDGTRLSYGVGGFGDYQLWVYDIELGVPRALTSTGENVVPVWSPDGTRLVFRRDSELFSIAADGSGEPERVGDGTTGFPSSWSTANILAFLHSAGPGEPLGLWTLEMDGESQPEGFIEAASLWPDFSPDGRWLAYVSDRTGEFEVYVRPFPEGAPVERISPNGGEQPVWSPNGQQLFYTRPDPETDAQQVMVVDVVTEPAFRPGQPRMLFEGPYRGTTPIRSVDVSPTGNRFVLSEPVEPEPQPVTEINVVLNWLDELKRLVPIN
jgi:serine/threonine-protein kinase